MARSAFTVWEVRTGGADTNGGGFVTGATGTDWSLQNGAQYSVTDGVTNGTTTITSATANFGTDVVGNIMYVTGGTGAVATDWYEIVSRTNATTIDVDRITGLTAGTGVTLKIGGAMLSPSIPIGKLLSGNTCYIKSGTYSITTNTTSTTAGAFLPGNAATMVIGYNTTRAFGNTDTQPLIQTGATTITTIQGNTTFWNINFDGNAQTSSAWSNAAATALNCTIQNYRANASTLNELVACLITGNTGVIVSLLFAYCEAYGNTNCQYRGGPFIRCLAYSNTGANTDGFLVDGSAAFECFSVANGRDGFRFNTTGVVTANCHAQSNTGFGYNNASSGNGILRAINCTGFSNTGGLINAANIIWQFAVTAVSGDVFVNIAGNNYALNNTAAAGAALRAAGRMLVAQTYPRGLTTSYFDIGGVQHQDPAGIQMARVFTGQ